MGADPTQGGNYTCKGITIGTDGSFDALDISGYFSAKGVTIVNAGWEIA